MFIKSFAWIKKIILQCLQRVTWCAKISSVKSFPALSLSLSPYTQIHPRLYPLFLLTNQTSRQNSKIESVPPVLPNAKFHTIHYAYLLLSFSLVFALLSVNPMRKENHGTVIDLFSFDWIWKFTRKRGIWIESNRNCWSHNVNANTKKWNEAKEGPKIGLTVSLRPRFASIVRPKDLFSLFFETQANGSTQAHPSDREKHQATISVVLKRFFFLVCWFPGIFLI